MSRALAMISGGLLLGAAAPIDVVLVRDFAAVASCQALGEVRGSSRLGGVFANAAYNNAVDHLKRNAAALGATHVQIIDSAAGFSGARMIGTAFKCPAPPPQG